MTLYPMQIVKLASFAAAALCGLLLGLTFAGFEGLFTRPWLYVVLLVAVVTLGIPAIAGHPHARFRSGEVGLRWRDARRAAPLWTILLSGTSFAILVLCTMLVPEFRAGGESSWGLGAADLAGRPDRWRVMLSFFVTVFSFAPMASASAIRRRFALLAVPRGGP